MSRSGTRDLILIDADGQQVARAACRWHVALLDIAAR
jgi:hypothetical protein